MLVFEGRAGEGPNFNPAPTVLATDTLAPALIYLLPSLSIQLPLSLSIDRSYPGPRRVGHVLCPVIEQQLEDGGVAVVGGVEHGTQTRGRQHLHPRPARQQQFHLCSNKEGGREGGSILWTMMRGR